jgi:trehalose/maltose transport system permease protein
MSNANHGTTRPPANQASRIPILLLGVCLIIFGLAAIAWLFLSISQNPIINLALNSAPQKNAETPSLMIAFLLEFGFVLPILTLGFGITFIWLGLKLQTRDIKTAYWSQFALNWLAVLVGVVIVYNFFQSLFANFSNEAPQDVTLNQGRAVSSFVYFLILAVLVFWILWLKRNINKYFDDQESLNAQEVRFAWNLLIPTLAVFLLVAARPLEQTFIRSLTDKRFAAQEVPNFVGLDNYQNLLGIRVDIVNCKLDEGDSACALTPNGDIQWKSIESDFLKEGYRTVWKIKLPFFDSPTALAISGLDNDFLQAIGTTLLFVVISVTLELSVALFIAVTVNSSFKGRGLMRAVMLVPWAIPTVISAKLWDLMLKDTSAGIINRVLMDLQLIDAPQAWLSVTSLQLPSAIMVDVWKTSPFMALLLLAGLQMIPSDLYEASSVDGATPAQQFFLITLPMLRPTIAVALVFRTLDALRVFDLFNVLFGRQQLSMATYNYEMLVNSQKDGYASAVSIIIFLMISIFAVIYVRMLRVETD